MLQQNQQSVTQDSTDTIMMVGCVAQLAERGSLAGELTLSCPALSSMGFIIISFFSVTFIIISNSSYRVQYSKLP